MSQASSPSSLAAEESPRQSLSGHGRDWRYYAGACGVAGALTASVRLWTRRTHLPLSVPEPPMVYSRRMASRAFLYATCINIFAGIGIVAAAAFYCEIDNVNDIGWKMRQKLRASGVHQSDTARAVRDSSAQLQRWLGETSIGKSLADAMRTPPQTSADGADASAPAAIANAAEPDSSLNITDSDVARWEQEASQWLEQVLSPSLSAASDGADGEEAGTNTAKSVNVSAPPPCAAASAASQCAVTSVVAESSPQAPASSASGDSLASKLKAFDQWFDATSIGKWLNRK